MKRRTDTRLRLAYMLCREATDALVAMNATCVERIEHVDSGAVCELWQLPNGKLLWLWATPQWWQFLRPLAVGGGRSSCVEALDAYASEVQQS